jgi:hypothetical protein
MKKFKIKSPSGKMLLIIAETIYHACEKAVQLESYKFNNTEYLKLNK